MPEPALGFGRTQKAQRTMKNTLDILVASTAVLLIGGAYLVLFGLGFVGLGYAVITYPARAGIVAAAVVISSFALDRWA